MNIKKVVSGALFGFILVGSIGCAGSPHRLSKMNSDELERVDDRHLIICMQLNGYATEHVYAEAVDRLLISKSEVDLIKDRRIKIGMSENALYASQGYGHKTNTHLSKRGKEKQVIYGTKIGKRTFVYVKNGYVTDVQY